ncbi:putative LRR receptor-like serine/threonine-protein kinase [Dorcoceras hygrometricum]|uniref:Putative LRR receptor-like serine/threonine-protein kinase n=1 Tax=Dorcoceras hygrometricum TaxID=472368 RepID=A0A2Z7BCF7_9LAMI|nr:putative LRR receptor-like serine/threonine-protein kinase [Dorcoceras hygrometricum]
MTSFASFRVLLISLGLFLAHCVAFPQNEVEALISFKRAIMEDPLLVFSNWNSLDAHPCGWSGISCSIAGDKVIKLNISGASLSGFIAPDLYQLSVLQELILHGNSLFGMIPKEISMLKSLKVLDLGSNRLTGMIPLEIGNLTSIVKLNLQSNGLTGKLPYELGNLKNLEELRLDRNKFLGTIPTNYGSKHSSISNEMQSSNGRPMSDCGSSQLKVVDLSYNFLVGSIPKCLDYLPRSSFTGNCLEENDPKQRPYAQCGGASPPIKARQGVNVTNRPVEGASIHQAKSAKHVWLLVLEIITGITVGLLFVVALFTAFQKCKSKPIPWKKSSSLKDDITIYIDSEILKDVARYSREELEAACEDFSNIIESSPDSVVYKGTTKDGQEIALVDFECWKTVLSRMEKSSGTISNMGAVCVFPNSMERHLDIQGNIYSFGILLLEIISGRPTYSKERGFLVDWAKKFLELPDVISYAVDPKLKYFRYEDLRTICEVVNLCIHPNSSTSTSMQHLCSILENGLDTSISADLKASSLAWAELALSS